MGSRGREMVFGKVRAGLIFTMFAVALTAFTLLLAAPAWAQTTTLSINKTDSPDPVVEGEILTYTIVVRNTGAEEATDVVVEDVLPAGTAFVSEETPEGTTCTTPDPGDPGTVTCELGDIPAGEDATITIQVRAREAGTITNTAAAEASNVPIPVEDTTTTRVLPDLEINKLDDPDPVTTEDLLLYTLRVQNQGNSRATDVAVTDELPLTEVDFVAVESRKFDCKITAGVVQCTGGVLEPGEVAKVEIVVEPEEAGTIQNTAAVFAGRTRIDTDTESTLVEDGGGGGNGDGNEDGNGDGDNGGGSNGDGGGATATTDNTTATTDDGTTATTDDVLVDTIPDKVLPATGGPPLLSLAILGLALIGVGSSVLRAAIRRDR